MYWEAVKAINDEILNTFDDQESINIQPKDHKEKVLFDENIDNDDKKSKSGEKERKKSHNIHSKMENEIANFLRYKNIKPLGDGWPPIDIRWKINNKLYIAEIKSINEFSENETHQLRIAIGQILEYKFKLENYCNQKVYRSLIIINNDVHKDWKDILIKAGINLFIFNKDKFNDLLL